MNIQNIVSLADQLNSLGFGDLRYPLLNRICFKPQRFILSQKMQKGEDKLVFHVYFEKHQIENCYALLYYDALLQKGIELPGATLNGINTITLEKQMAAIDWECAFDIDEKKQWNAEDIPSWETEHRIEAIVSDLATLEGTDEGNAMAIHLKLKYWADSASPELIGNTSLLKNKSEISQRFYFTEGQTGITLEEAYRFLQNRWLEKHMQPSRKRTEDANGREAAPNNKVSLSNVLLRKRRLNISKRGTKNKSIQID